RQARMTSHKPACHYQSRLDEGIRDFAAHSDSLPPAASALNRRMRSEFANSHGYPPGRAKLYSEAAEEGAPR
ncbi:MAG TPA: hypothetical protein VGG45_00040, partial [Terracidiphilus sp.]